MCDLVILIITIIISAFFSGIEIAFISINRMQIELEKQKKSFLSKLFIFFYNHPNQYISTLLIGNTISLVIFGYYISKLFNNYLLVYFNSSSTSLLIFIETIISTIVILITAEYIPKSIFRRNPYKFFKFFLFHSYFVYLLIYPLSWIINKITNIIIKLFKFNYIEEENILFKEEISCFINEKLKKIDDQKIDSEIHILKNALEFSSLRARDCMVPRKEIIGLEFHDTLDKIKEKFIYTGFSKLIIYKNNIDSIIGYVHVFDMFKYPKNIKNIILPIEVIHETTLASKIMNLLIKKRRSVAIVLDEYGGTAGMLTIEDLVEKLLGDIKDEHDKLLFIENKISDKKYLFSARLKINYLNYKYNLNIKKSESYETLGGFIYSKLANIPKTGESFQKENLKFTIKKASKIRIEEVYIEILKI